MSTLNCTVKHCTHPMHVELYACQEQRSAVTNACFVDPGTVLQLANAQRTAGEMAQISWAHRGHLEQGYTYAARLQHVTAVPCGSALHRRHTWYVSAHLCKICTATPFARKFSKHLDSTRILFESFLVATSPYDHSGDELSKSTHSTMGIT